MPKHAPGTAPVPVSTASPAPGTATCSVEAPSQPVVGEAAAKAAKRGPQIAGTYATPLPSRLTPKVQNAIRIFSTGISIKESCTRAGVGEKYFRRVMNAPIGKSYFDTITARTESAFIDKAAAVQASDKKVSVGVSTVQNEIDEAVLESVQELRSIVKTSKSDQARALAAKELLDLAQAKKRYMAEKTGSDTDIELGVDDIKAYAAATADLRLLHIGGKLEEMGEDLRPPADSDIVRTIDAAVDPDTLAAATAAIDQPSVAENARPDGRLTTAPVDASAEDAP